jgi:3-oxoacyl-[acyl-carrier-protein] synthase II
MRRKVSIDITGAGCLCGAGGTLGECMSNLFQGTRNPMPPKRFTSTHSIPYPVFEVSEESIPEAIKNSPYISFTGKLALAAAYQAFENGGLDGADLKGKKVGVCVGTTVGAVMNNETFYGDYFRGGSPGMSAIDRYLRSNPAALIAEEFGLTGPCQTVVNACSSGTDAVGIGASWIQAGLCDMVIAGGADELCHVTYNGFISLMITDDVPCRPFDRERKGLNLGEGAAMLVLESEASRRKRHTSPMALFLGYASSADAHHLTAPHPEGAGLKRATLAALRFAGRSKEDVAFINAHGTATFDNDRVESKVLSELFPGVPFFSTKGYTGHTLGAAGAIEAAFTVACLDSGKMPGNAGFADVDPELAVTPVMTTATFTGSTAVSQSLAFGGCNGVLVLGKRED